MLGAHTDVTVTVR